MKRPERRKRTEFDMVTVFGETVAQPPPNASATSTMYYDPATDELTVKMWERAWFRISPGQRFAAELAELMTKRAFSEEELATLPDVSRCPACGAHVRPVMINGELWHLDAAPDERGVYLLAGEGAARPLYPMEEPTAPTYAMHRCKERTT